MELDLDDDLAADLAEEADERGFESPEAYARWVLTHRSAVFNPSRDRLLSHLDRLAGEVDRLRAALESKHVPDGSDPAGQAWFNTSTDGESGDDENEMAENPAESADTGFEFGESETQAEQSQSAEVNDFAYSSDLEPPDTDQSSTASDEDAVPADEATEEGADDDEIADAIADIDLADEEAPENERETTE